MSYEEAKAAVMTLGPEPGDCFVWHGLEGFSGKAEVRSVKGGCFDYIYLRHAQAVYTCSVFDWDKYVRLCALTLFR